MNDLIFIAATRFIGCDVLPPLRTLAEHVLWVTVLLSSSELATNRNRPHRPQHVWLLSTLRSSTQVQQLYIVSMATALFFFLSVFIGCKQTNSKGAQYHILCANAAVGFFVIDSFISHFQSGSVGLFPAAAVSIKPALMNSLFTTCSASKQQTDAARDSLWWRKYLKPDIFLRIWWRPNKK